MSPSRVHSQPSPRSAHGSWIMHVHSHDALADPRALRVPQYAGSGADILCAVSAAGCDPGRRAGCADSALAARALFVADREAPITQFCDAPRPPPRCRDIG